MGKIRELDIIRNSTYEEDTAINQNILLLMKKKKKKKKTQKPMQSFANMSKYGSIKYIKYVFKKLKFSSLPLIFIKKGENH